MKLRLGQTSYSSVVQPLIAYTDGTAVSNFGWVRGELGIDPWSAFAGFFMFCRNTSSARPATHNVGVDSWVTRGRVPVYTVLKNLRLPQ